MFSTTQTCFRIWKRRQKENMENSCISGDFKSLFPDAVNPYFQTFAETRNLNRRKKNEKRTIMPSGNEMAANDRFIPGGYTDGPNGGSPEIVTDKIPNDDTHRRITFGIYR